MASSAENPRALNSVLGVLLVNTKATTTKFITVQDDVVGNGTNLTRSPLVHEQYLLEEE